MASKYLGSFDNWDIWIASTFGDYRDEEAVREIQRERYKLITDGRQRTTDNSKGRHGNIFCTAITLDHKTKREISPFDDLETTFHIYSLWNGRDNMKDQIGCVCSYAFESQEREGGTIIGLPQENKIKNNGYPLGFDLDPFREKYEYRGRKTTPEERIELFRHFKTTKFTGDIVSRLGVYRGGFQEFIKERKMKGKTPATKWLFCSNAKYYHKVYRPLGSRLVPLLLKDANLEASPPLKDLIFLEDDHTENSGGCIYNGIKVSYRYPIIISRNPGEEKKTKWYDYFSQLVDWDKWDDDIERNRFLTEQIPINIKNIKSVLKQHVILRTIGEDVFKKNDSSMLCGFLNYLSREIIKANPSEGWEGDLY